MSGYKDEIRFFNKIIKAAKRDLKEKLQDVLWGNLKKFDVEGLGSKVEQSGVHVNVETGFARCNRSCCSCRPLGDLFLMSFQYKRWGTKSAVLILCKSLSEAIMRLQRSELTYEVDVFQMCCLKYSFCFPGWCVCAELQWRDAFSFACTLRWELWMASMSRRNDIINIMTLFFYCWYIWCCGVWECRRMIAQQGQTISMTVPNPSGLCKLTAF